MHECTQTIDALDQVDAMDAIDGPIFGRNLILQLTSSTCLALGVELLPGTQVPSHASFYGISQGTFSTDDMRENGCGSRDRLMLTPHLLLGS